MLLALLRFIDSTKESKIRTLYVPYLKAAGELKTKPIQHSVKELQQEGVQPDIIVLRTEHPISQQMRHKVALFCNVEYDAVIENANMKRLIPKIMWVCPYGFLKMMLVSVPTAGFLRSSVIQWIVTRIRIFWILCLRGARRRPS